VSGAYERLALNRRLWEDRTQVGTRTDVRSGFAAGARGGYQSQMSEGAEGSMMATKVGLIARAGRGGSDGEVGWVERTRLTKRWW
jgi:hypothetical protein